jgi:PAS domain S-box-containing protein
MPLRELTEGRVEEFAFLRALGEAMASDLRADKALARAVDLCFVRFELGALCAFRADEGGFRLVAAHGVGPAWRKRLVEVSDHDLTAMLGGPPVGGLHQMVHTAKCTICSDLDETPGLRAALFAPLVHARRRVGALLIVGNAGDALGPEVRATWESVSNTIAVALRAADDFERVVALEAEKRQLVDNLPVIVARFDAKTGAMIFVNGAVQRVLGMRPSDALRAPGIDGALLDAMEREASSASRALAASGLHSAWQDRRYTHADGRVLTLRECVYPVFDGARTVYAVEIIAYDITTEIEARKELMQADRLASLGALAAGIAHEINNPVAFISLAAGQVGRLVSQIESHDEGAADRLRELAKDVSESASRIAEIVGELKLFTRMGDGSVSCPIDLNRVVHTAIALTSAEVRRHARLDFNLGAIPLAPGAFANLGHAFVNLLMNAAQAVESKLAGNGHHDPSSPNIVRVETLMRDGSIVVRVEDTGIGIDEQALPRIFDPFFKTKTGGTGAGLGLAIAYDLVRRVGGDIRVESTAGRGTKFEVVLPLGSEAVDIPVSTRLDESLSSLEAAFDPQALPRVLIIDDERALVKALARQLSERYDVDTASTAVDALAHLSTHQYAVIVCDLRMPDQSGPQLYEEVRTRSPSQAARFIFTTGGSYGTVDDQVHERADATGLPVLEKPFDGATFEAVVARVATLGSGADDDDRHGVLHHGGGPRPGTSPLV